MYAQRPLKQAHPRVQQHGLKASRYPGVPHRHGHRQGLVPAVDVAGAVRLVGLLPCQGFPHRRPLRTRRGYDVVHPQVAECLQYGLASVKSLGSHHRLLKSAGLGRCRLTRTRKAPAFRPLYGVGQHAVPPRPQPEQDWAGLPARFPIQSQTDTVWADVAGPGDDSAVSWLFPDMR